MTGQCTISAVIPAYNSQDTIGRALDSVLDQSFAPDDVIVVDDGSSDATGDVVRRYGGRVRCIRQRNAGPSAARNRGIDEARGDWIAFLDADDVWYPRKLERQAELIRSRPRLGVVFCNWVDKDFAGRKVSEGFDHDSYRIRPRESQASSLGGGLNVIVEDMFQILLTNYFLHTNTAVVRADLLGKTRFDTKISWGEDWLLFLDLAHRGAEFGFVDELLTEYRAREGSICTRSTLKTVRDRYAAAKSPLQRYGKLTIDQRRRLYPCIRTAGSILGIRLLDELGDLAAARRVWRESALLRPVLPHTRLLAQSIIPGAFLETGRWLKRKVARDGTAA